MPKKLFKSTRGTPLNDKKDEFNRERLPQSAGKIPVSPNSDALSDLDFVDYGDGGGFPHLLDTFSRYGEITFTGGEKRERHKPPGKRHMRC